MMTWEVAYRITYSWISGGSQSQRLCNTTKFVWHNSFVDELAGWDHPKILAESYVHCLVKLEQRGDWSYLTIERGPWSHLVVSTISKRYSLAHSHLYRSSPHWAQYTAKSSRVPQLVLCISFLQSPKPAPSHSRLRSSFWRWDKIHFGKYTEWTFPGIFLLLRRPAEPKRAAQDLFKNSAFEAIYYFRVIGYHTLTVIRYILWQFSFIVFPNVSEIEQNKTKEQRSPITVPPV